MFVPGLIGPVTLPRLQLLKVLLYSTQVPRFPYALSGVSSVEKDLWGYLIEQLLQPGLAIL
jgi:hypothetical protein